MKKEEDWIASPWAGAYTGFKNSDELLFDTRASHGVGMCWCF